MNHVFVHRKKVEGVRIHCGWPFWSWRRRSSHDPQLPSVEFALIVSSTLQGSTPISVPSHGDEIDFDQDRGSESNRRKTIEANFPAYWIILIEIPVG